MASGIRTSTRTMRSAPNRSRPAPAHVRAGTSGGSAGRPWRSRRSSRDAPRRRAGRNNWGRGCRRQPDIRSRAAPAPDRRESRKPSPRTISARVRPAPRAGPRTPRLLRRSAEAVDQGVELRPRLRRKFRPPAHQDGDRRLARSGRSARVGIAANSGANSLSARAWFRVAAMSTAHGIKESRSR